MVPMLRSLLESNGLDAVSLGREAGLDFTSIPGSSDRLPIDKVDALLRLAIDRIADPAFGLKAARCWHPANLGVLGHAWLSSSSLRAGFNRLGRYWSVVGERGRIVLRDVRDGLEVSFVGNRGDPSSVPIAAVLVDIGLSIMVDMCRLNAGAALRPVRVAMRRKKPLDTGPYERFFGRKVDFGADQDAIVLTAADADRVLPSANRQLITVFDKLLAAELAHIGKADLAMRCRSAILEKLPSGELAAKEIARELNLSSRSLQRKLAQAGTSFEELLDETRRELALHYIIDRRHSMIDIAFLLGFSEPSSFARAFRRWTGTSPTQYRAAPGIAH